MNKVSIKERQEDEVKRDLVEATALEKTALAELIDAEAEKLKKISELEGITVDKLIQLQDNISTILNTGVELQKLFQADLDFAQGDLASKEEATDEEVIKVKEEINEVEEDGTKKVEKVITKQKEE
ncbi:hypothetical protein [Halanaerobaculum tunisiense]